MLSGTARDRERPASFRDVLAVGEFRAIYSASTLSSMQHGDRYVVGIALHTATVQPAQVAGYFIGAAMASGHPRLALLLNAGTFATSAALTHFGVRLRPPALSRERRTHLLRETVDGFRVVFSSPALRFIVLIVFCGS